jgi:urea transporter
VEYATLLRTFVRPYSAILFTDNVYVGILLIAITFVNPSVAISGVIALGFSVGFALLIGFKESLHESFYLYNPLLVGMGVGYLVSPSWASVVLIAVASIATFILSFVLNRILSPSRVPVLSLPFSIVTMMAYLASLNHSALLSSLVHQQHTQELLISPMLIPFFNALGTIFFLPMSGAGLLIFGILLYRSRIMAIMALVGFYFGVMIHGLWIGSSIQALNDPYAFNYLLVAIALCGIFLLPTFKNFVLALMGVAVSVLLSDALSVFLAYYSLPVLTFPFALTVIAFLFILSLIDYPEFNHFMKATPEASLSHYLSTIFRFGKIATKISPPFSGTWQVYQGFKGEWTHKGNYQYAYDFIKTVEGKSYQGEGKYPQEYYAFGESVLSPVSGYIVDMRHDLVDNPIGENDRVNNWGNYLIIRSDAGFFVEISHLMQYSIKVAVGDYVLINSILANCGNSGYSPQPHIHIQVQAVGFIGGFTQKFCFSDYLQEGRFHLNDLPNHNDIITSLINDKSIASRFIFILDDTFTYEVFEHDLKIKEVTFRVKMDTTGEFYLEDETLNRLYFYNDAKQFYFYHYQGKESHLKWLFIVAPRLPFVGGHTITFSDYLPVYLVKNGWERAAIELIATVCKTFYKITREYRFDGTNLSSQDGSVTLKSNQKGFETLQYNYTQLRRIL